MDRGVAVVTGGSKGIAGSTRSTATGGGACSPEEVAAAIAWLVSDDASYRTGAILDVSGGR